MTIKYYPYLRAKTYDVMAVVNSAPALAQNGKVLPIFEPVRDPSTTLIRHASTFGSAGLAVALVLNPQVGNLVGSPAITARILNDMRSAGATVIPAFSITARTQMSEVQSFQSQFPGQAIYLHWGVPIGLAQVTAAIQAAVGAKHVFLDGATSAAYQSSFSAGSRVLLRDGFQAKAKNAAYPSQSFFGDLHLTYGGLGFDGFGDFATVGYRFSDSGGPAYAVAIHLNEDFQKQGIFCNHFLSTSNQTPTDPAGKFGEAVASLAAYCQLHPRKLDFSAACRELLQWHSSGSYHGLGVVKRLSIQHHLELMGSLV